MTTQPGHARSSATRLVMLALVAIAVVAAVKLLPVNDWLLAFVGWIRSAGVTGMVVFVFAYVLACILLLPGLILTLGAGFAYGVAVGIPLVWVSANLGAAVAFLLGRTLARDRIAARVADNPKFAAIDRAVGREGLKIVLLTRLSPAFPFNLLNYAYGLTQVTFRDYAIGSLVGMIPGTAMYVYLGSLITSVTELASGAPAGGTAKQVLTWVGFAATVAVTVVITRIARRALDEATAGPAESTAPASPDTTRHDDGPLILPDDEHNRKLLAAVHPSGHANPTPRGRYNLVVIGAGTAGLVSAAGAAGLGARVALIESHLMGGDCLNMGCVPSKALISAARAAASARHAVDLGVRVGSVDVDFGAVMERMRRLRAGLAPIDGAGRFTRLGVDVYLGAARFTSPTTVLVDGRSLEFSRAIIATGARAAAPPIPGLEETGYLTNETVFWLTELPRRLIVIGGGPIGCEMSQTFRSFGSDVTVIHMDAHVLPRDDADAAAIVERRLTADGVRLVHRARIDRVERRGAEVVVSWTADGASQGTVGDRILVAVGRTRNVAGLGLEAAEVRAEGSGVVVDDHLRTSNPRIYAVGDVASRFQFTHVADALARIAVQNALFGTFGRKKASALTIPWCTYTTPEVAHVGLSTDDAAARNIAVSTITIPLHDVDRAVLEGDDEGFLRVHLREGTDKILGATLVAAHAGDMISELTLAMTAGLGLGSIAATIHPYPTEAEAMKKAADAYNRTRLTPLVKKVFAWWLARSR
ncbi:MAG TPA: FAD-containing oxidoreductase [Candidatus Binatia bacterium]|nr:FAD-containing oxidoreductase [Candidatus Binatia bacterium]